MRCLGYISIHTVSDHPNISCGAGQIKGWEHNAARSQERWEIPHGRTSPMKGANLSLHWWQAHCKDHPPTSEGLWAILDIISTQRIELAIIRRKRGEVRRNQEKEKRKWGEFYFFYTNFSNYSFRFSSILSSLIWSSDDEILNYTPHLIIDSTHQKKRPSLCSTGCVVVSLNVPPEHYRNINPGIWKYPPWWPPDIKKAAIINLKPTR